MNSALRYLMPCLAALAAGCGDEGRDPAAPELTSSTRSAPVEAVTTAPALGVSSHALYYCYQPGVIRHCLVLKHQLRITSTGAPLKWTASADKPWIVVSPAQGTTPTTVTVSVGVRTPLLSIMRGTVTITAAGASNSPRKILVEVNYTGQAPPPSLAFSDSSLGFCYVPGGNRMCIKLTEDVRFKSTGAALAWQAVSSAPWITLNPTSGTTPTTVHVTADPAKAPSWPGGLVFGSITVSAAAARNSPWTIPVSLRK